MENKSEPTNTVQPTKTHKQMFKDLKPLFLVFAKTPKDSTPPSKLDVHSSKTFTLQTFYQWRKGENDEQWTILTHIARSTSYIYETQYGLIMLRTACSVGPTTSSHKYGAITNFSDTPDSILKKDRLGKYKAWLLIGQCNKQSSWHSNTIYHIFAEPNTIKSIDHSINHSINHSNDPNDTKLKLMPSKESKNYTNLVVGTTHTVQSCSSWKKTEEDTLIGNYAINWYKNSAPKRKLVPPSSPRPAPAINTPPNYPNLFSPIPFPNTGLLVTHLSPLVSYPPLPNYNFWTTQYSQTPPIPLIPTPTLLNSAQNSFLFFNQSPADSQHTRTVNNKEINSFQR